MTPPVLLTIAGTDSGGGAGTGADLATFAALGAHGACVVTAVTAQDTTGVHAIHPIPADVVLAQLDAVLADLAPAAIKTGMLGSPETVVCLTTRISEVSGTRPLVVDPVLRATSGADLATPDVIEAYREHLLPVATVITPNAEEAQTLLGLAPDDPAPPADLAVRLAAHGPAVIVTGGPDASHPGEACTDWLALAGRDPLPIVHPAIATRNDHGTGCTYSSALAVHLARGEPLRCAARRAAAYVARQLHLSATWELGRGRGPIAHIHPHDPVHPLEAR